MGGLRHWPTQRLHRRGLRWAAARSQPPPPRHQTSGAWTVSQAVSRNPVFAFKVKGAKSGDKITITWTDNKGDKRTDEVAIGAG